MLEVTGGNKDKVGNAQGWCSPVRLWMPAGSLPEKLMPGDAWKREKSWALTDPDLNSLPSGWKVGLC